MQTAKKTPLPRFPPLLSDALSGLVPSDDPGIVDAVACFGCRGNMYTDRRLAIDTLSRFAIPAFSRHVSILYIITVTKLRRVGRTEHVEGKGVRNSYECLDRKSKEKGLN
jgi:hypothetical protein